MRGKGAVKGELKPNMGERKPAREGKSPVSQNNSSLTLQRLVRKK